MKENLTEVFNNIKERVSNPLIFSFACAWLIINWQVTLSLFVDIKQVEKEGANTIFTFINQRNRINNFLWQPLTVAVGYTLLMPVIRNLIKALNSWAHKWGENWNLKILKGSSVSLSKYLKLRDNYETRSKYLEEIISKENVFAEELTRLRNERIDSDTQLIGLRREVVERDQLISQFTDINLINGRWENTYTIEGRDSEKEEVIIDGDRYYTIGAFGERYLKFHIVNFSYDNRNGNVFFIKMLSSDEKAVRPPNEYFSINQLRFENDDLMVGRENLTTRIAYKRLAN